MKTPPRPSSRVVSHYTNVTVRAVPRTTNCAVGNVDDKVTEGFDRLKDQLIILDVDRYEVVEDVMVPSVVIVPVSVSVPPGNVVSVNITGIRS
jgi:hypothetical protein